MRIVRMILSSAGDARISRRRWEEWGLGLVGVKLLAQTPIIRGLCSSPT